MDTQFPRPARDEAASYYDSYIDLVPAGDIVGILASQAEPSLDLYRSISAEKSLSRYAEGKWSIRQVLNHITDSERVMLFRAYWFARRLEGPLPGMDQDVAASAADADRVDWEDHIAEFHAVRTATLSFFRNLPGEAWTRRGVASGYPFSVRALAYIVAGHSLHHEGVLRDRYL